MENNGVDYEKISRELGLYLRDYKPKGWREKLSKVSFVPRFLPEHAEVLMKGYNEGTLEKTIKYLHDAIYPHPELESSVVKQGIKDFFDRLYKTPVVKK